MKTTVLADMLGVTMLATVGLLPLGCLPVPQPAAAVDLQPDVAVYGTYSLMVSGPRPSPVEPADGCKSGCRCNGTGIEPTGDGLARVPCRCPDTCKCKAKKESVSCQSGTCRLQTQRIVR